MTTNTTDITDVAPTRRRVIRPLNPDTFPDRTRHIALWHLLIQDADRFTEHTGYGLAVVWHLIKTGDYDRARAQLDQYIDDYRDMRDHENETRAAV